MSAKVENTHMEISVFPMEQLYTGQLTLGSQELQNYSLIKEQVKCMLKSTVIIFKMSSSKSQYVLTVVAI